MTTRTLVEGNTWCTMPSTVALVAETDHTAVFERQVYPLPGHREAIVGRRRIERVLGLPLSVFERHSPQEAASGVRLRIANPPGQYQGVSRQSHGLDLSIPRHDQPPRVFLCWSVPVPAVLDLATAKHQRLLAFQPTRLS